MARVEDETNRHLIIRPDDQIRGRGRAIFVVSDPNPDHHLVLFDPLESRYLDHLVAHECGHIGLCYRRRPDVRRATAHRRR